MTRVGFAVLAAALAITPAARASPDDVVRDCADDGVLSRPHTDGEKRAALKRIPADLDEYSDCRSTIAASIGRGGGAKGGSGTGGESKGGDGHPARTAARASESRELSGSGRERQVSRSKPGGERVVGELLGDGGGNAATRAAAGGGGLPFAVWGLLATAGLLGLGAARETPIELRRRRGT